MTGVRKVTENIVERFSETSENEIMIKIDNVKKQYRLGTIGGGTLRGDLQSWWAKVRGKEDTNSKIGAKEISTQIATALSRLATGVIIAMNIP